jgi:hypothetical protein
MPEGECLEGRRQLRGCRQLGVACELATSHWNEALRVLRYLKGTRSHGIVLGGNDEEVVGFVDSDGSGDLDGRKSTSGYVFQVYGGPIL